VREAFARVFNGCDIFTFQSGKIAVKSSYFKNRTA